MRTPTILTPLKTPTRFTKAVNFTGRIGVLVIAASFCLMHSPHAIADTMLLGTTDMVSGTSADTFSFTAPGPGTVTAEVSSMPWPTPLSSLSFSATTPSQVLASWSGAPQSSMSDVETFQVGSGTYYAHVTATAGGPLDLGLYSLLLTFTPSAVPLPSSAWMMLIGALVLVGLISALRSNESVTYGA